MQRAKTTMTRNQLVRQLAEIATRPIGSATESGGIGTPDPIDTPATESPRNAVELFVWFEDTSARVADGGRGMAGLPESLLPYSRAMRIVERVYAQDHFHLLSAVRLACNEDAADLAAALYTSALSVGTVAWIGTGSQYAQAWRDMYARASTGSSD
jgi:hypothetical protein